MKNTCIADIGISSFVFSWLGVAPFVKACYDHILSIYILLCTR